MNPTQSSDSPARSDGIAPPDLVSVIVPCRNERKSIGPFITSLLAQKTDGFELEVLVADGMSDDGTRDILNGLQMLDQRVRVIDNPRRIVSTGLNAMILAARGEIIVRMDAHTEYASDYISRCVEALEETGADNVGGAPRIRGDGFRMKLLAAAYHSPFAVGGALSHNVDYEGYVDSVFYGCWRRQTLLRLGLFDEDLVRNQDDELNLRLIRSGGRVWQSRNIVCWYSPRSRIGNLFRQYFQYGFWKVAVIRKHHLPASWRHLVPGSFVLAHFLLAAIMLFGWLARVPNVVSAAASAWGTMMVLYGLLSVMAATGAAAGRSWLLVPFLPPLFLIYHISYGVGFLAGIYFSILQGIHGPRAPDWASRLSR